MRSDAWHEVSPSRFDWEREALHWLRERLPDHEPWRAWSNFEFAAPDGSVNEVDLFVVGRTGIYLVEIKSHCGRVSGDQGDITFTTGDGRRTSIRHPRWAANQKAKRLADLLRRTAALRNCRLPFIDAVVFLSNAESLKDLSATARAGLFLRDARDGAQPPAGPPAAEPGILAALLERVGAGLRPQLDGIVDRPLAKRITKALAEIGIRGQRERRIAGDYELLETLEETAAYRDSLGRHLRIKNDFRRVRRYFVPDGGRLDAARIADAAEREVMLLRRLEIDSVLRCTHHTVDELGPILFFEHVPDAQPLHAWLAARGKSLSLATRLRLLRGIAETIGYAHSRQVIHRCLSPASVLLIGGSGPSPSGTSPRFKVMNWQAGAADGSASASMLASGSLGSSILAATLHAEDYHDRIAGAYVAPELRIEPQTAHPTVDVFSLGALAYLLVTLEPPAASREELLERLRAGLRPSSVLDGVPEALDRLVADATAGEVTRRIQSVDELLERLNAVEAELFAPASATGADGVVDPADAGKGSKLIDATGTEYEVLDRLGAGSTAIGFRVRRRRDGAVEDFILKLAREPKHSESIRREQEVLAGLKHPHIVQLKESVTFGDRAGLLLLPANSRTLRRLLDEEGALHLELLERFGHQLLDAVAYLEQVGVSHRDLKPDNIAVSDFDRRQRQGILLFDFSLSGAPADNLAIGTPAYADHFLGERPRQQRRWDLAAERFSAAITLHELATGSRPIWGDGRSDPATTKGEVILDGNLLPYGVRPQLLGFFRRALARRVGDRFESAEAMRDAWDAAFRDTSVTPLVDRASDLTGVLESRLTQGKRTPTMDLPLSTRALNVLDRLGLHTVEQLLRAPRRTVLWARGVGQKTRMELEELLRLLSRRYSDITIEVPPPATTRGQTAAPADLSAAPLAALAGDLLAAMKPNRSEFRIGRAILGLDPQRLEPPTQSEVAGALDISRQRVGQAMTKMRAVWAKSPAVDAVRSFLAALLDRLGGAVTFAEARRHLVDERGLDLEPEQAHRYAVALVRAAAEAEDLAAEPRWQLRRRNDRILLVRDDETADYAVALGAMAEKLARRTPLPDAATVERELGAIEAPRSIEPLSPHRMLELAAAVAGVAVSARRELYPVGMSGANALVLSASLLLGAGSPDDPVAPTRRTLTIADIDARVRSRYPEAAPLPQRPLLDDLLRPLGLEWKDEKACYEMPVRERYSLPSGSSTLTRLSTLDAGPEPRAAPKTIGGTEALRFEEEVRSLIGGRRFAVVRARARWFTRTLAELRRRFPQLVLVDIDRLFIEEVDAVLAARRVSERVFLDAFAAGEGQPEQWGRVQRVLAEAAERLEQRLVADPAPALVVNVGLLLRHGLMAPIEALNGIATNRTIRAALILVPGDISATDTAVDGVPIPIYAESQRMSVPDAWLRNEHRAA